MTKNTENGAKWIQKNCIKTYRDIFLGEKKFRNRGRNIAVAKLSIETMGDIFLFGIFWQ